MTPNNNLSQLTTSEIKNLYKLSNNQIDDFINRLSENDIKYIFSSLSIEEIALIYFRVSRESRHKLIRSFSILKNYIFSLEGKNPYLNKLENVLVFNNKTTFSELMKTIDFKLSKFYIREYIALEDEKSKFLGVIYATDIIANFHIKYKSYLQICMNYTIPIMINKKYKSGDKKLDEEGLIDCHKTIIIDESFRTIGAINIDYILLTHDLYLNKQETYMYALPKKDIEHVMIITFASIGGTLCACLISNKLNLSSILIIIITIVRCINEVIILLVIEDKISDIIFDKYYKIVILISSIFISLFIYGITFDNGMFLISLTAVSTICLAVTKGSRYVYEKYERIGLLPILIVPEISTPILIYFFSRIFL